TAEDLMKYKKMIKDFFDEVLKHSLKVEQRTGFRRMKIYKTIEIVDQKLLDLSDAILKQQEKGLNILARIGQIQGLLVDILA
ncbi:MAG: YaaR family protein, partial [Syntrophomonadaceae bacterium]|nr:YaaR family protein [Syntrophomonadaceae bacterium]